MAVYRGGFGLGPYSARSFGLDGSIVDAGTATTATATAAARALRYANTAAIAAAAAAASGTVQVLRLAPGEGRPVLHLAGTSARAIAVAIPAGQRVRETRGHTLSSGMVRAVGRRKWELDSTPAESWGAATPSPAGWVDLEGAQPADWINAAPPVAGWAARRGPPAPATWQPGPPSGAAWSEQASPAGAWRPAAAPVGGF